MKDQNKSKEQLIRELVELRDKVVRLKELEVEHKLAMRELQKSEERFYQIFQASPDYLLITRLRDGTILHCNDSFLRTMGYARDEVIGKSTKDLGNWVYPADRKRFVRTLLEQKQCIALETAFRTKDGRITPILISARIMELDGEVRVISAISDITKLKQTEDTLRESEEKFRTLFEESRDAICLTTRDGRITDVNQFAVELFGFTRDELNELNVADLYRNPVDRDRFVREIERTGFVRDFEVTYRKRDGREMPCLLTATIRCSKDGTVVGYQGIIRDISAQKLAEQALRKASEEIKLFAYSVSHDLKSPAIGIYGLTKMLSNHLQTTIDEKAQNYCDQIVKAAEQIALLAERINLFIATKEAPVNIQSVKLEEILQMLRAEFSSQISTRQIRWLEPAHTPEINADRISLLRALRNLVDNALKYGGDELSEIAIGYRENDQFHMLSVRDDGIGMKMEDSSRIFGFFQRHETSRGIEGSGLGLAIVKEIAEQHGGKAWMEAVPEGGTTFHISISKQL